MTTTQMVYSDRWLAVIRVATGLWFIKAIATKWVLIGGFLPIPMASERWIDTMPRILQGFADANPFDWARNLLEQAIIPNAPLFAHLTAVGEGLVGIGLTFGLMTRASSIGALFLLLVYQIAALGLPFPRHGQRLFMIVAVIAFLFARAGMVWGVDAWLSQRRALKSG